jgi:PPK2 family polyphosphate:nucleotide phosphotransferase
VKTHNLINKYRVTDGSHFRLKHFNPDDTDGLESADDAAEQLTRDIAQLSELQDKLYAQDRWALLIIFQAMDAAGKDSAIKHVMSGVNPQGCQVHSFKQPTTEELDHDYLWRAARNLPNRGHIGIFNRSYYEEVLVVRVHRELLDSQRIPRKLITKKIWDERCHDIRAFERYLGRNGIIIRKFFLNVSKAEQKKRFLARLDQPEKSWKFSAADVRERSYWDEYMQAYEEAIQQTASPDSPWYVVPADHKWFTRLVVASAIIETLNNLDLDYPKIDREQRRELQAERTRLEADSKK